MAGVSGEFTALSLCIETEGYTKVGDTFQKQFRHFATRRKGDGVRRVEQAHVNIHHGLPRTIRNIGSHQSNISPSFESFLSRCLISQLARPRRRPWHFPFSRCPEFIVGGRAHKVKIAHKYMCCVAGKSERSPSANPPEDEGREAPLSAYNETGNREDIFCYIW